MPKTMQQVHEEGGHFRHPKKRCPQCQENGTCARCKGTGRIDLSAEYGAPAGSSQVCCFCGGSGLETSERAEYKRTLETQKREHTGIFVARALALALLLPLAGCFSPTEPGNRTPRPVCATVTYPVRWQDSKTGQLVHPYPWTFDSVGVRICQPGGR